MDKTGLVIESSVRNSTILNTPLIGRRVDDLLMYPAQVAKFYTVMHHVLRRRDGQFISYMLFDKIYFALLLPHCGDSVKVHEVYVKSIRKRRSAINFLLDIYNRSEYAKDVKKEQIIT